MCKDVQNGTEVGERERERTKQERQQRKKDKNYVKKKKKTLISLGLAHKTQCMLVHSVTDRASGDRVG